MNRNTTEFLIVHKINVLQGQINSIHMHYLIRVNVNTSVFELDSTHQ
jgi:hypothetical protein